MKSNFVVKCIAVVLFAVMLTTALLSSACLVCGIALGAFTTEAEQKEHKAELLESMLWQTAREIRRVTRDYAELEDVPYKDYNIYHSENVLYEVKNAKGEVIYSDLDGTEGTIHIYDEFTFNILKKEYKENGIIEESTTLYYEVYDDNGEIIDVYQNKYYEQKGYSINIYLKDELVAKDGFYYATELFDLIAGQQTTHFISAIISAVLSLALFIFLMCSSGHKDGVEGIHISRFDRFPVDVLSAIYLGLTFLLGLGIFYLFDTFYNMQMYYDSTIGMVIPFFIGLSVIGIVLDFVLFAILSMTTAVRLKTRTYIKSTLIYIVLKFAFKFIKWSCKVICKFCKKTIHLIWSFIRSIPFVWKTVLSVVSILFVEFCILGAFDWGYFWPTVWVMNAVIGAFAIVVAILLKRIKKGTEEIAKGNIYKKINTKYMFLDIKDHAENINNINDGIAKAVEERIKSERFKTELITNVSHDIKTPLTSIINYVDLLEKEEIENETAKEYIDVLSRQSARLKKLIEDLLEASKASTGNISVNLTQLELGILLSQALGEYDEKFSKNNLQVVLNKTDDLLLVMADNRHIWRVFDNILNNISKYAQPNTRVYIDAKRNGRNAEISFRNISKDALNISGDELMERFVRGDSSRNTEGSGLGLSIAKSLTEVQKGSLKIEIDGDLFKVRLTFPISE